MEKVYTIPKYRYSELTNKINKLNRKAEKIGCPKIKIEKLGEITVPMPKFDAYGTPIFSCASPSTSKYQAVQVKIEGQSPKFDGWTFIGILDHRPDGNIIRSIPGHEMPTKYRTANPNCDHCKHNRYRKKTFVCLHEETGEYRQIGSTCVKDFLGHNSPDWIASSCEFLIGLDSYCSEPEDFHHFPRGEMLFSTEHIMEKAAVIVNNYGWVSKSKAQTDFELTSTANTLINHLFNPKIKWPETTDDDKALAIEALTWAKDLYKKKTLSDYEHNIFTLANMDNIKEQDLGLAVSIIGVYKGRKDKAAEREQKEKTNKPSEHFGEAKQRLDLEITVLYQNNYETNYGITTIYKMITKSGDLCVWFSTSNVCLEDNQTYKIKGTVKAHSEYNGKKETILTRVKVTN